jgi:hypothetical protein
MNTPRKDELMQEQLRITGHIGPHNCPEWLVVHARKMECELAELHEWKKQALAVMPDFQQIGNALSLPLGSNVSEEILPGINRLKDQRDALADALSVIKTIASPPHHERAFPAIIEIASNTLKGQTP